MTQQLLNPGPLLDPKGELSQAGYQTSLVKAYDRKAIRAGKSRIKEWDYYLVYNDQYGVALTIDDNSYMGLVSASILDFGARASLTQSPMFWLPMGKTALPGTSQRGSSRKALHGTEAEFFFEGENRRIRCSMDDFGGRKLSVDLTLGPPPHDSMVIATPFPGNRKAFYYNQKIIGMTAAGNVRWGEQNYRFEPDASFGLLDWGRGVWTYENTWYWSAGQGLVRGHRVGFNLGYGFGDTSKATENMLFCDGVAHKLEQVSFQIPQNADGTEEYLSPWTFTSSDGRFEAEFLPILDRASCTDVKLICSDQHQVFGRFNGEMRLDDGTIVPLRDFLGFAEKVYNKW